MKVAGLIIGLILAVYFFQLKSAADLAVCLDCLNQRTRLTGARPRTEASSVTCKLQGSTRLPAFSMDGDFIIGGSFSLHAYMHTVYNNYTSMPEAVKCKGRSVKAVCG